jgi:ubiquinone/menaquinone biosynthesis C-methylase UbiE
MARIFDTEGRETEMLRRIVSFRDLDVLDVGCGDGRTARYIAETASSVIGLDPDAEAIESARTADHAAGSCPVEYLREDAVTVEFPSATFDAVIFTRSL